MIGLQRHSVRVVAYNPYWSELAANACGKLREIGGSLLVDVQHVGSTAVPGLPAKPILDLAAAVVTLDILPELILRLAKLGYIYRGDGADQGGHLFVWEPEPHVRSIHLHVVAINDRQWRNYLRFRDLLRQDSDLRTKYAALKADLQLRFAKNRQAYTASKQEFIQSVLNQAVAPTHCQTPPEA